MILPEFLQQKDTSECVGSHLSSFFASGICGTKAVYLGETSRELHVCSCTAYLPGLGIYRPARAYLRPENGYLQQKRVLLVLDCPPAGEEQQ